MPLEDAVKLSNQENLDLVLISPTANPPVCKIMDYGKHRFDMLKKEKEVKKKQKVAELKGMQLGVNIQDNDIQYKAKQVKRFLDSGDKVKVTLRMFGRQLANTQLGFAVMNKFYEILKDDCELSSKPEMNGRQIIMILSPKNIKL